ncbi:helix-turn-helix domain-containing protein [Acinetobacter guillouiae]|uniref:helix-turn-helix domain-containing protein n=1 Tax=Acinetobacter guillouiae TaxID=106649 RepID=UPI003AF9A53F
MRLSPQKITMLINMFCLDNTASKTAELTRINRNTVNYWYNKFRNLIYLKRKKERSSFEYKDNSNLNFHKLVLSIHKKENNIFIDFTPVDEYHMLIFFLEKTLIKLLIKILITFF